MCDSVALMSIDSIDKIDAQVKTLKARKQKIIAQDRDRERKNRTRRLILLGTFAEALIKAIPDVKQRAIAYIEKLGKEQDKKVMTEYLRKLKK